MAQELSFVGTDWSAVPDLYESVASCIFRAEVRAIYGEGIFRVRPSFDSDFWAFYRCVPTIAKGLPWWLAPGSYGAQRRMQDNMMAWRSWCCSLSTQDSSSSEAAYDDDTGTLYTRRMCPRHGKLGLTDRGVACALVGYYGNLFLKCGEQHFRLGISTV